MEENTILNEKITHKDNEVFDKRALTKLNAKKLAVMEHKRIDW